MKQEALTSRRSRELTRHEIDLWLHVTHDVRKMYPESIKSRMDQPARITTQELKKQKTLSESPSVPAKINHPLSSKHQTRLPSAYPPLAPIEPKIRRRLARRQMGVDAVIDLHGMRQEEAHQEVLGFLRNCYLNGARVVLIVTGKGAVSKQAEHDTFRRTGVLRQIVPQWLREPGLRKIVIGFEEAAPSQGGYGALYVRIRRSDDHTALHAR